MNEGGRDDRIAASEIVGLTGPMPVYMCEDRVKGTLLTAELASRFGFGVSLAFLLVCVFNGLERKGLIPRVEDLP